MPAAPFPSDEQARQRAVRSYASLSGDRDDWTDELVRAASLMTGCPIALVTILDGERQWFRGCIGLDVSGTPREQAFCGYTILGTKAMVVEDASTDPRFHDNPLVTGEPRIRFYAGVPIIDENGQPLGSLCVIDRKPRSISAEQIAGLESLSALVSRQIASAHRHDAIMGSALDAIVTIDSAGRVIEFNQPATAIFGYEASEAIGQPLAELIVPPQLRDAHRAGMQRYLETGEGPVLGKRIEISAMRKGGQEFPVELAISPWKLGGEECFTAFIRDITDAHALNAELRVTRFTMEHAVDGIMWVDAQARFMYANRAACENLGYSPAEIQEMSVFDIEGTLTREMWPDHWAELRDRKSLLIESTHRRRDGSVFPVEISCNFIEHEGQEFNCVIVRDATERLASQAALQRSDRRFRDIAEAAGEAIWETDSETRYTYASEQIHAIMGTPRSDLMGKTLLECIVAEDAGRVSALLARSAHTREPFRGIEARYRHSDGQVRWLRISGRALHDDQELIGFRGLSLDVTESNEAASRRRRHMELQGIVRSVVSMFIEPGAFDDASARLLSEIGAFYEAESAHVLFLEKGVWNLHRGWAREPASGSVTTGCAERWQAPDKTALMRDSIVVQQMTDARRETSHLGIPVFVGGEAYGYIGFDRCRRVPSVLEEKQALLLSLAESMGHAIELERNRQALVDSAERLEVALEKANEANAAKSAFLAHMSHELRTPLTAVLGFGRMLRDHGEHDPRTIELLSKIDSNGQSLLNIINSLLDLSKVEAGAVVARHEPAELLRCIRRAADAAIGTAEIKGIDFHILIRSGVPRVVKTDQVRLSQILTNLLGNAVKYTLEGSVTMHVGIRGEQLLFEVEDTGPGIGQPEAQRVFEAFDRGAVHEDGGGTGLGLAIAKRLAELMGGAISLDSEPGRGSVFSVVLPLERIGDDVMNPGELDLSRTIGDRVDAAEPSELLAGVRVLLAEDSEHVQDVIAYFLRARGAIVEVCQNGLEATEQIAQNPSGFDLVLMDMQMPVLDGYNATREIRKRGLRLPIVALTAHGMQHERDRCLAAGCDDYISKPVEPDYLASVCHQLISEREDPGPAPANPSPAQSHGRTDSAGMLEELSRRFRSHLIEQASQFESELHASSLDRAEIAKRVHKIAGAAGNLGFPEVTGAAQASERVLRSNAGEADARAGLRNLITTIRSATKARD